MRVTADILMIVGAVVSLGVSCAGYDELLAMQSLYPSLGWFLDAEFALLAGITEAGVIMTGGILCLQRKLWGFCLAASIVGWAILPLIFICVRRAEWETAGASSQVSGPSGSAPLAQS